MMILIISTLLIALMAVVVNAWLLVRLRKVEWLYRRQLLSVQPAAGQVWEHDGALLFVVQVTANGVRWSLQHPLAEDYHPQASGHLDSWDDWRLRLRHRDMVLTSKTWSQR